ncbi:hypothetical protein QBL02_01355 [Leucobacter sp. UT-8R-CII-1-4]|uniref:DUF7927 domain-containing protein n=1 Tax=Leucobacter sp. UT-8R-CII-1-4 TaxID=3040075 RepID=UPI0024A88DC6|nr:hypothetical protein [Leucobacter sp. UT-8R-CII-1-4]MDI6022186.1 hypothetical protein [Leucobacter sp. UT-8R-CII-1-4]
MLLATALFAGMLGLLSTVSTAPAEAVQVDPTGCSYAPGSKGKFADTICWIDFSGYDPVKAKSEAGQPYRLEIGGGYVATFDLKMRAVPGSNYYEIVPRETSQMVSGSTLQGAFSNNYYASAQGKPVLWNNGPGSGSGSGFTARLDNIIVSGPDGSKIDDFRFVSGDAESTGAGEFVTFTSDKPLNFLEALRPPQSTMGCFREINIVGEGTTSVTCNGRTGAGSHGTNLNNVAANVLYYSQTPSFIEQTVRSGSLNAGVFGFMMSKVKLNKVVDSRAFASDTFDLNVRSGDSLIESANTGSETAISTGEVTVLANSSVTLEEVAGEGTDLSNYRTNWSCTNNGDPAGIIVPEDGDTRLQLSSGETNVGDFVECTITNTAKPASIKIEKTSDATVDVRPGDTVSYTVKATNTGQVSYSAENPAVIWDDLSGVLDDADYQNDASASLPGELSYSEPRLNWSGALAVGKSVELKYTVKIKAGGDRAVKNVSFVGTPTEPEPPTPECEPASDQVSCTLIELPALKITKVADQTELPKTGAPVTYTVTVTNVGPGAYTAENPAKFTDDMTEVLDDAEYANDAVASTGTVTFDDPKLKWEGALDANESATITYSVVYNAKGDQKLRNVACVPELDVATGELRCDTTTIPGPLLSKWKTVSSSATPTVAGSVLTYSLFFKNNGQANAVVDAEDIMTGVLDDAEVTSEPTATGGLIAVRNGEVISVTGSVAPGETAWVTYQVTVKPDGDRGDDEAANFVVESGELPPEDCKPKQNEAANCTVTPIAAIEYKKTVEATTDPVAAGTVLRYTITATSTGKAEAKVSKEDILTDVLDDADLTKDPYSDTASVTASAVQNNRFEIGGTLAAGASAQIRYEVTVKPDSERGNNSAANFVVDPGKTPPIECIEADPMCTVTDLPNITVTKSSNPESGSDVMAGQEITYTLTYTNTGKARGEILVDGKPSIDNLSSVLDDAELIVTAVSSSPDVRASSGTSGEILVTGLLEAGETATVTYTVKVKPDGERGDNVLRNVVLCNTPAGCETVHNVGELEYGKSVDPAHGSTLRAGETATYTLRFANVGEAALEFLKDDVLSDVLDDADLVAAPVASSADISVTDVVDSRFTISGVLQPGQIETVTYQVKVKADGERGDDRIANFVVDHGTEPPQECEITPEEDPKCTVNHVSDVKVEKTSNPASGSEVKPGQKVSYSLTFVNRSKNPDAAPVGIDYTDDMSDVLDDADLIGTAVSSDPDVTVTTSNTKIRVVGAVASGKTVTVTYTVQVKDYAKQGNHDLGNVVTVTGEPPVCVPDSKLCTEHPVPKPPTLALTGGTAMTGAAITALLLLGLGAGLIVRKRKRASSLK